MAHIGTATGTSILYTEREIGRIGFMLASGGFHGAGITGLPDLFDKRNQIKVR